VQAIELAADALANVKFVQEKRLIQKYFDEISQDTNKYCFGVDDTLKALELGAVETLIVWENLDITRHVFRNAAGGEDACYSIMSFGVSWIYQRKFSSMPPKNRRKTASDSWTNPLV
jgi:peptide subunit release factor 1 (eRF1)